MPTNQYFQNGQRSEKELYENLIIEAIKIYGTDVYYIPRHTITKDNILNEDLLSKFSHSFKIEMYVESIDGYEGDGKLLSKFGLEIRDQMNLIVSKRRWIQGVGRYGLSVNNNRPTEGDLIFFPLSPIKKLFEIKYVANEKPFLQLKDAPIWTLTCELFEYESQNINTGVHEIDSIEYNNSDSNIFEYNPEAESSTGEFLVGESLTFSYGDTSGLVKFYKYKLDENKNQIIVGVPTFMTGAPTQLGVGTVFTGSKSGASVTVIDSYAIGDNNDLLFTNDRMSQNSKFKQAAVEEDFIDFSEDNPFGEPS
jgi:hypothetical protein